MNSKLAKFRLLISLPVLTFAIGLFCLILILPDNIQAQSNDAIAIRIIPNPNHFSILRWYSNQNFTGSPQIITIDGYEAIRDGRTAYINMADIKNSTLYTNILIISYNQDFEAVTTDIFGQIIKNLKFNTNISEPGTCSASTSAACLYSSDCPSGEYCNSQKAKVIRDVKRLEDMAEINTRLENYKQLNNHYPQLDSGSYVSGITLSTWPSWQKSLSSDLGFSLPVDPLNKLGACPNFDKTTCWNEKTFLFASNLSKYILPSGSHAYLFQSVNSGNGIKYCFQAESGYTNLKDSNCFQDTQLNHAPTIDAVNLSGISRNEFMGYVKISDVDNNPLSLTVDLVSPSASTWLTNNWQWKTGFDKFVVLPTINPEQRQIYALKTGNYNSAADYYQIKLTVDDGQGMPNSVYSKVYPISLTEMPAYLEPVNNKIIIGKNFSAPMTGVDFNSNPFTQIYFQDANYDNSSLTQVELANKGFSLNGVSLTEKFAASQHTGNYQVNVYALNPGRTTKIPSSFTYTIINNPPVFQKLVASFSNNTSQTCDGLSDNCSIIIDNGELASINFTGFDSDGHNISYDLVDDFNGQLVIDKTSGKISGLEKLNYLATTDKTFSIAVKMSDQYCANSSPSECSSIYSFSLTVKGFCSMADVTSQSQIKVAGPIIVDTSGETLNTGLNLSDCSAIGSSTATVKFIGGNETLPDHDKAIVLVNDVSASMGTNVVINGEALPAMVRLKQALTKTGGFLDQLHQKAIEQGNKNNSTIWFDDFSFSSGIRENQFTWMDSGSMPPLQFPIEPFANLNDGISNSSISPTLNQKKSDINSYMVYSSTDTLRALNYAELKFKTVTDQNTEKILILMSDGLPAIEAINYSEPTCEQYICQCNQGKYPNCTYVAPTCTYPQTARWCANDCILPKCADYTCANQSCTGDYPNCNWDNYVSPFSFNNLFNLKNLISRIFNVNSAQAITIQTECNGNPKTIDCPSPDKNGNYFYSYAYMNSVSYNCNTSNNIKTQIKALKDSGITIYTIYYNTSNSLAPENDMCVWSSNNGTNCGKGYSFSGTNIDQIITNITNNLISYKPKDATVGNSNIIDSDPSNQLSESLVDIRGLACGPINPVVTFKNKGALEFSNLKINYCAAKLHK